MVIIKSTIVDLPLPDDSLKSAGHGKRTVGLLVLRASKQIPGQAWAWLAKIGWPLQANTVIYTALKPPRNLVAEPSNLYSMYLVVAPIFSPCPMTGQMRDRHR